MKEKRTLHTWAPKLPDEDALRKQSLKYIAMHSWVRAYLIEMTAAQLALKTAYAAYRQWCDLTNTPWVPIQAFNKAITSGPGTDWPSVGKKRTAKGIVYQNLTLRTWAKAVPPLEESGLHVASGAR